MYSISPWKASCQLESTDLSTQGDQRGGKNVLAESLVSTLREVSTLRDVSTRIYGLDLGVYMADCMRMSNMWQEPQLTSRNLLWQYTHLLHSIVFCIQSTQWSQLPQQICAAILASWSIMSIPTCHVTLISYCHVWGTFDPYTHSCYVTSSSSCFTVLGSAAPGRRPSARRRRWAAAPWSCRPLSGGRRSGCSQRNSWPCERKLA
jgi:hypothetical protein